MLTGVFEILVKEKKRKNNTKYCELVDHGNIRSEQLKLHSCRLKKFHDRHVVIFENCEI